jgi:hypothetical protein
MKGFSSSFLPSTLRRRRPPTPIICNRSVNASAELFGDMDRVVDIESVRKDCKDILGDAATVEGPDWKEPRRDVSSPR